MPPERSRNAWNGSAAGAVPADRLVRATRIDDQQLLLWAGESEGAWLQSDATAPLRDAGPATDG